MADVITTPQNDVVADRREGLDRVVFEYETVIANRNTVEESRFRTDVADHLVALLFDLLINRFAQLVHSGRRHRREELKIRRWVFFLHTFKLHDRQSLKTL